MFSGCLLVRTEKPMGRSIISLGRGGFFFANALTVQPHRSPPAAMFLRRLRTSAALRRGASDGGVLAALRAELASSAPSDPPPFHSQVTHHLILRLLGGPLTPTLSLFPTFAGRP